MTNIHARHAALAAVAVLYAAAAVAQCPLPSFRGVTEWYGGTTPRLLTFANVNGDRWPDLIVGSIEYNGHPEGGIVVLAGDGGRSWPVLDELVPAHNIAAMAVADFDLDGDDDLVYFQAGTDGDPDSGHHIRVLINEHGRFAEQTVIVLPPAPGAFRDLLAGDFNGDGNPDFLYASATTLLYLGHGDGTFTAVSVPAAQVVAAEAEDLDGDGDDDAVLSFLDGNVRRLAWFGFDVHGAATIRRIYATDLDPNFVTIADTDGNGALDVLASDGSQSFRVFFSAAEANGATERYEGEPFWILPPVAADFDGDGTADLGFYTFSHGFRYIHGVDAGPDPTVASPGVWVPRLEFHSYENRGIDTADVDRDGDIDVALATDYGFAVLENDGTGAFEAPPFATWAYAVGDFNNDGRDDLVDQEGDELGVRLASPGGTFEPAGIGITQQQVKYDFIDAGDFDGDGNLDLVTFSDPGFGEVRIRLGNGDGTFQEPGPAMPLTRRPDDYALADFDGDGNLDILVIVSAFDHHLEVLYGDGHGGFARVTTQSLTSFTLSVAAGDLDGDGDVDLAIGGANHADGRDLLVSYNDGHGTFGTPVAVGAYSVGYPIVVADVTSDGRPDIITVGQIEPLPILRNDGGGAFTPVGGLLAELDSVGEIHPRDFNRDGYVDLLVLEEGGHTGVEGWLLLYLGRGDGTFQEPLRMRTYGAFRNAVGDFNGDGAFDLLDGGFVRLNSCVVARFRGVRH